MENAAPKGLPNMKVTDFLDFVKSLIGICAPLSEETARGPIPIYLFCSLIFMPSVTKIQWNKLRALFPA